MPTGPGCVSPLTLAACHPGWDNYLDLNETLAEMAQRLMEEDGQQGEVVPKGGAIPKEKDTTKIVVLPPNDDTTFMPASEFPSAQYGLGTHKNPVNLSDAPTEASNMETCPEGVDPVDESRILGSLVMLSMRCPRASWIWKMATSEPSMRSSLRWRRPAGHFPH